MDKNVDFSKVLCFKFLINMSKDMNLYVYGLIKHPS